MLSAVHAQAPISALPGSVSRLRVHPRNIKLGQRDEQLIDAVATAVRRAHANAAKPCTLLVDASELSLDHLSADFIHELNQRAASDDLGRRIAAIEIQNANSLSKAIYSVAKHLGSSLCEKVVLK